MNPITDEQALEAIEAFRRTGNKQTAADSLGQPVSTFKSRLKRAVARGLVSHADEGVARAMEAVDTKIVPSGFWTKTKGDENTPALSVYTRVAPEEREAFRDEIVTLIEDLARPPADLPPRFDVAEGMMMVLDPSDVHIGKLSVKTETGVSYDAAIAEHRLVEGCKALMLKGKHNGVSHVLFVIGNDIAHIDNPRRQTTGGTPQDTDGSLFTIFQVALRGYSRVVEEALRQELSIQIIFNPSNHDWILGYCIAQTVAARWKDHPNVTVTDYGVSEIHRKYVRFGLNIIGLSHGDGAKEGDLGQIMLQEARPHMAECLHRYWYLHHYHHKIKKALGIRSMSREKDHIGMTVIRSGAGAMEGDNVMVEYVRSPSAPDGWHNRNGYLNRQAVEAFVHHPTEGQTDRFTAWF